MTSVSPMAAPLEAAEGPVVALLTRHRGLVRQALMLRRTQVGLAAIVLMVGLALIGPLFAPHSATAFVGPPFSGPSGPPRSAPIPSAATCSAGFLTVGARS